MTAESNPHAMLAEPRRPHRAPGAEGAFRSWVEVDLAAIRRNASMIAERARVPLLPMVKADAYGCGAVPVVRALESLAPWGYGVASVPEGEELRGAGVRRPVVVFTPLLPNELSRAHGAGLTPSLHRADDVAAWAALGGGPWQLAIDTGMSRAGVRWDEIDALRSAVAAHPPQGAFTHFHSADTDRASVACQERRFLDAIDRLPVRPSMLHVENGPGVEHGTGSPWSVVRPGVFLYGVPSGGGLEPAPVVHLRARIVDVRTVADGDTVSYGATWRSTGDRRIATVAAGYADGYRRHLGNRGVALLHGRRVPVVGHVTMDMTMLDVTGGGAEIGDVVTLIGADGGDLLTVSAVAGYGDLSPYELLTGLRLRVPRIHVHES